MALAAMDRVVSWIKDGSIFERSAQSIRSCATAIRDQVLEVCETALFHPKGRNGIRRIARLDQPETLVIHEEKCAVSAVIDLWDKDRTTQGEAELVLAVFRLCNHLLFRKIVVCVEAFIPNDIPIHLHYSHTSP